MHAAADREQLLARPGGLRAVLRIGHHHHRRRDDRPVCHAHRAAAAYVDVAVQRWQAFTGETATLDGDGRRLPTVAAERRPSKARAEWAGAHTSPIRRSAARSRPWRPTAFRRPTSRACVGIDPKTLRKHYRDELDLGETKANAQVAGFLFNAARNGNVTAQIFWLKTRARWRETPVELRHSGSIATRDLSQVSDEDLWNMIAKLDAEIGFNPSKQSRRMRAPWKAKDSPRSFARFNPWTRMPRRSEGKVCARELAHEIVRRVQVVDGRSDHSFPYVVRVSDPPTAHEQLQLLACRIMRQPIAIMPAKCLTIAEWLERYAPSLIDNVNSEIA